MRVAHVISGLGLGGAETMLCALLEAGGKGDAAVFSLSKGGGLSDRVRRTGARLEEFSLGRNPASFFSFVAALRRFNPDVVQTWMYHANLAGGLAAELIGTPSVWGIHAGLIKPGTLKLSSMAALKVGGKLCRWWPAAVAVCARSAMKAHVEAGYAEEKMAWIPNGFDASVFRPDAAARAEARTRWGWDENRFVAGLAARLDPWKGLGTFLKAAALFAGRAPEARFVLCGQGLEGRPKMLAELLDVPALKGRVLLDGPRLDMPRWTAALDVLVSASDGEAFPMVLGEAMACGVPCLSTDVGDSGFLMGDAGRLVPPGDPGALARGLDALLKEGPEGRKRLGAAARARIEGEFPLAKAAASYAALYEKVVRL